MFFHLTEPKKAKPSSCAMVNSLRDLSSDHPVRKPWSWVPSLGARLAEACGAVWKERYQKPWRSYKDPSGKVDSSRSAVMQT